jgi:hypothetical protein
MQRILICLFIISAASVIHAELFNLNPQVTARELEGIRFSQLEFQREKERITYEPPRGWTFSVQGPQKIVFFAAGDAQADVSIEHLETPGGFSLDEAGMALLQQEAARSLPKGLESAKLESQRPNPLIISECNTYEAVFSYALHGRRFQTSVLFLDMGETRMRFVFSSSQRDFEQLHGAFKRSLYSWQWHRPAAPASSPSAGG